MMRAHVPHITIPDTAIPALSPDRWLYQIFSPLAVAKAGTIRCAIAEVEANLGRDRFLSEAALRGYRVKEEAGQFTLTLAREPLKVMI